MIRIAVLVFFVLASAVNARDYVPYTIVRVEKTPTKTFVPKKGPDGKPMMDASGSPLFSQVTKSGSIRYFAYFQKSLIGIDWAWRDKVLEIPELYHRDFEDAKSGQRVKLPTGWESWPKVVGDDRKVIIREAKAAGTQVISPKSSRLRVEIDGLK